MWRLQRKCIIRFRLVFNKHILRQMFHRNYYYVLKNIIFNPWKFRKQAIILPTVYLREVRVTSLHPSFSLGNASILVLCICIAFYLWVSLLSKNICFISCGFHKDKNGLSMRILLQLRLSCFQKEGTGFLQRHLFQCQYLNPNFVTLFYAFNYCGYFFQKSMRFYQDLENIYQFLPFLPVWVSVVSLIRYGTKFII